MLTKFGITVLVHTSTDDPSTDDVVGAAPFVRELTLATPEGGSFYRAAQCSTAWARTLEEIFLAFGVVNALVRSTGAGPR